MRKVLIFTLLVLCQYGWAGVRPESKMRQIAAGKLFGNASAASKLEILDETSAYHIYGKGKQGFVVVSTDENAKEVLGYSSRPFDKNNLPPAFKCWLKAIEYATIDKSVNANYTVVPNFMTSTWGQTDPFDFLCPQVSGEKAPSGCVATAMSQIMYYYKFPAQGKGSGYYTLGSSTTHYKEDIKGVYQWDKMYDDYSSVTLTDEIRTPVATLLKDAGLGSHMNYDVDGSGTNHYDAATSFVENFSYAANQIRICEKAFYTAEEYNAIIYAELAAHRPVLAVGSDPTQGGHAFIFSGVDADGKVYVNWGWDGDADGYYEITNLNPKGILGLSSMVFSLNNAVVVGIVPGTGDPSEAKTISQWISEDKLTLTPWAGFDYMEVSLGTVYNGSPFTFEGKVQLCFKSIDGDKSKDVTYVLVDTNNTGYEPVDPGYGYSFSTLAGLWAADVNLKPGQYDVYLASLGNDETTPQAVLYPGGEKCHYLLTYKNGEFTVEEYTPTAISSVYLTPTTDHAARIFDLQGREVKTPQKGIYIINGKKVVK